MLEPLVNAIVPTYNRAYCLTRAVDSVLGQSYPNIEVIIVDDGSTDGTADLVRTRYGDEPRVRYVRQANSGVGAARNRGMSEARGDMVAFLDSDDTWYPWKIQTQIAAMTRRPEVGLVWTDMEAVNPSGEIVDPSYIKKYYGCYRLYELDDMFPTSVAVADLGGTPPPAAVGARFYFGGIFAYMFMGNLIHTSTVIARRDVMRKAGGFDESMGQWGEDYDLFLRACRQTPAGFIDASTIRYQIDMPDRATQKKYATLCAGNCLKTITGAYDEAADELKLKSRVVRNRFAGVHRWYGESLLDSGERAKARMQFVRSLGYRPWQPRTCEMLALSLMPSKMETSVRRFYRGIKRRLGGTRREPLAA